MNTKKWIALVLFALAAIFNLVGNWFDISLMERVTKPVLMPLVLLNALLALEGTTAPKKIASLLCFALCFHCAGDIFLMIPGFVFFAVGLVCFLIGHIYYIAILTRKGVLREANKYWLAASDAFVVVFPLTLVMNLGFQGPIKYAVLIYAIALMYVAMNGLWGALNKKSGVASPAYLLVFFGGLLFLFSDFLVAWRSLLGHSFPHIGFAIMFTYILAECLIVTGLVRPYLTAGRRPE